MKRPRLRPARRSPLRRGWRSRPLEALEDRLLLTATLDGNEFRVNDYISGSQSTNPDGLAVTTNTDNDFIITYGGRGTGDSAGIFTQRYDATGMPLGNATRVNTTTLGIQELSSVASADDGQYLVAWSGRGATDRDGAFVQRFDAAGNAVGGEIRVNVTTAGKQTDPAVAMLADGSFVAVWCGNGNGDTEGIFLRRFSANGTPLSGEVRVNTLTTKAQTQPAVGMDDAGNIVVAWTSTGEDGSGQGVFARRYDANGNPLGSPFQVNGTATGDQQQAQVAMAADGRFWVVWEANQPGTNGFDILARRYSAAGVAQGDEFVVHTDTAGEQRYPKVTIADNGRVAVSWSSLSEASGGWDVFAQYFTGDGARDGSAVRINTTVAGGQRFASLALANNGDTLAAWSGNGPGDARGVFAQQLSATGFENQPPDLAPIANTSIGTDQLLTFTATATDPDGPNSGLRFQLDPDSGETPAGATIDPITGVFRWTPTRSQLGQHTITVLVTDSGRPALADSQHFTVTVGTVNQAPSYTSGPNQTINEDAGPQATSWATNVLVGPPDEFLTQNPMFVVTVDRPELFIQGGAPTINPAGVLSYTPAANANGVATVTVVLMDNGGTAFGGVDKTAPRTFTITINPVNDAPSFTPGGNQSVAEDSGAQALSWATNVLSGPANEASQALNFLVTTPNVNLFATNGQPAINAAGVLTYTPAANANGVATITVRLQDNGGTANGGDNDSDPVNFTITITSVNDPPLAVNDAFTRDEDSGQSTLTVLGNDTRGNDTDNTETLRVVEVGATSNGGTATVGDNGANVRYTPAANFFGTETFTYTIEDAGGLRSTATVTMTINPVNDPPTFDPATLPNQTVNEDAAAQSVANFVTNISQGPNETGQTVSFLVTTAQSNLFATGGQPAISANGTLTYTLAAHASGVATIDVRAQDSGSNTAPNSNISAVRSFTITINPVNDAPSFTLPASPNQSVPDGAGLQTVNNFATNISPGPNESSQTVSFLIDVPAAEQALFAQLPQISPTGTLTYRMNSTSTTGTATVNVRLMDNGGTANGGVDTSAVQSFTITVVNVNSPPSFTVPATAPAVNEDSGAQTVADFVTNVSPGPVDEVGQTVAFQATVPLAQQALFAVLPQITGSGASRTLTYTPAANAHGTVTVSLVAMDNGGTMMGGQDTSAPQQFTITINSVNDAPSFTLVANPNQPLNEDAAAQSVANFIATQSPGPADESAQTISFLVSVDNASLFAAGGSPAISAAGTLTYTLAANANGSATVSVRAKDSGGTANGGVDESGTLTFTITVNPLNDPPSFTLPATAPAVAEDAAAQTVAGFVSNVSPGPADEAAQTVTFLVTTAQTDLFAAGGQPAISPTGTLTYTPAANAFGTATIDVRAVDTGANGNGNVNTSAVQSFTITINPVNDPPSFNVAQNQLDVNEDAGPQSIANFAQDIVLGPANETGQTATFIVSISQVIGNRPSNQFFTTAPAIDAAGTLTFQTATDAFGLAQISVTLNDGQGQNNLSVPRSFVIAVAPQNDPPVAVDDAANVIEDGGPISINVLTNDTVGPDDPAEKSNFIVTGVSDVLPGDMVTVAVDGKSINYSPAPDANGTRTFTYTVSDGSGGTDTAQVTVQVTPVNDAPGFTKGADVFAPENSGARTIAGWATALSAGPADEASQVLSFEITDNSNPGLFAAGGAPAISSNGTLTFTPAADTRGSATITVRIHDDGGTANGGVDVSATQVFVITVEDVNDPPSFSLPAEPNLIRSEDAGPQSIENFATNVVPGPASESSQTVDLLVSVDQPGLFAALPSFSGTGTERTLNFTPAADAFGTATITVRAKDSGGTAGGGVDESAPQQFTITLNPVNDIPSFTAGNNVSVAEDAGAQSQAWATNILAGPANENSQTLTFLVENDNAGLFAVAPAIAADGTLTFTPAADAVGTATVTVRLMDNGGTAGGGVDQSGSVQFTITVTAVNDPPSFVAGPNQMANEDAGAQTVNAWATAVLPGPANEAGQAVTFLIEVDNPSLFSVQPAIDGDGNLTYTPAADAFGAAVVTVRLRDNGGTPADNTDDATSAPQQFTITVNPVNDAPSFTPGDDDTVLEDSGARSLAWATAISAGPANEASQTRSFLVENDNPSLFAVAPAIAADGTLTFTPAANASGTANVTVRLNDDGGTSNGGVDQAGPVVFTITVTPVNDAPSFSLAAQPNQVIANDDLSQVVADFATNRSAGPGETQDLTFVLTTSNDAAFATLPSISATTGELTYAIDPSFTSGVITVNVRLMDNGGTANGGVDQSAEQTFTITVVNVNTAPSFDLPANPNQTSAEDAGLRTIESFATNLSPGQPDEAGQTLAFVITGNTNPGLFAEGPAIAADGTLTYRAAPDANGTATITVVLMDNGGTLLGGVDTSAPRSFDIEILPVNDAPSFSLPATPNQAANEDAGLQTVSLATAISAGPANETGQTLTFEVTSDNPGLFAEGPAIAADGTLTYRPALNANGSATVSVVLRDNGGTANGGVDASPTQQFTITVTPVNDAPSFTLPANPDQTVDDIDGAQSVAGFAQNILAGPANESAQTLTFGIEVTNAALFAVAPAIDPVTGTLTYTPAVGANGTTMVTVTLTDNGGVQNGGVDTSAAQQFTITVNQVQTEPTIDPVSDKSVNELTTLSFDITASDPDNLALTFSLDANPQGATLVQTNGTTANFVWTPLESQGPGNFSFTVRVMATDGGSAFRTFNVSVNEVNLAPTLAAIDQKQGVVGVPLSFTAQANDTDAPANTLMFSLDPAAAPLNTATINPTTGLFQWTPTQAGNFSITVRVTDNGSPNLSAARTVSIVVSPAGGAPIITADLLSDTGIDGDRVSSETDVTGNLAVDGTVTAFTASYGDAPGGADPVDLLNLGVLGGGNNFLIDFGTLQAIRLQQFGSGTLPDGSYVLNLSATDNSNRTGTLAFNFTRDTTLPPVPNFKVSVDQDPDQNDTTSSEFVTLVGTTEPNATVTLDRGSVSVTANASGQFQFNNVQLFAGTNSLGTVATDVAGNISTFSRIITFTPPGVPGALTAWVAAPGTGGSASTGSVSRLVAPASDLGPAIDVTDPAYDVGYDVTDPATDGGFDLTDPAAQFGLNLPRLSAPVNDPDAPWTSAVDQIFGDDEDGFSWGWI